jgi:hypothetical protein
VKAVEILEDAVLVVEHIVKFPADQRLDCE